MERNLLSQFWRPANLGHLHPELGLLTFIDVTVSVHLYLTTTFLHISTTCRSACLCCLAFGIVLQADAQPPATDMTATIGTALATLVSS